MWIALGEQLIDSVIDAVVFLWFTALLTLMLTLTL
jgi:hypothetical protein